MRLRKVLVNFLCGFVPNKKLRHMLRHKVLKKKVLIISWNFSGGGLETRINSIIERFYKNYDFTLLTATNPASFRVQPHTMLTNIHNIHFNDKNLHEIDEFIKKNNFDVIDVHPFNSENIIDLPSIPMSTKIFYTLHGEASLDCFLQNKTLRNYDKIISVSSVLLKKIYNSRTEYKDKLYLIKNCCDTSFTQKNTINFYTSRRNVLFSITNFNSNMEFIFDVMTQFPADTHFDFIGFDPLLIADKIEPIKERFDVNFLGFSNTSIVLASKNYYIGCTRGGFSAMDIISCNIPTISIYDRLIDNEINYYIDGICATNFEKLSNQNFVSCELYTKARFKEILYAIDTSPEKFQCKHLLHRFNSCKEFRKLFD